MTGPDHYRAAEQLLGLAEGVNNDLATNPPAPHLHAAKNAGMKVLVEFAQVHATLALAAATAEMDVYSGPNGTDGTGRTLKQVNAWDAAFGVTA